MAKINILDHQTIDKIAAGEVVERPASVVKELVENAIDAGAGAVTVEIREGGTTLIRVTDNGSGIEKSEVGNAFLRHATSKISTADDLTRVVSLGFRGEALASIAAVSQVEMITRTAQDLTGLRFVIEGGIEREREEIGAPQGTTLLVRNLFYNTPPRKKFLKQPRTEGSYVADLMEHLAMSNPAVSFKFLQNGQTRFYTTGSGDLKEIAYRIYGRDVSEALMPFFCEFPGVCVKGLLGKPVVNRANRSYEIFYINGRYIRSRLIGNAVEEGYREYLMQHKFPFCILHFQVDTERIDVNVHPSKMEVRIADGQDFYERLRDAVHEALHSHEMIPAVSLMSERKKPVVQKEMEDAPEPFETVRIIERQEERENALRQKAIKQSFLQEITLNEDTAAYTAEKEPSMESTPEPVAAMEGVSEKKPRQMELLADRILSEQARAQYEILGQLFETYWLISYQDKLLIVDQHAAHEKVRYERLMRHYQEKDIVSQSLNPPLIVTLNNKERECYLSHADDFASFGFVVESFGGSDYAIRGVPMDLYGCTEGDSFYEILDELAKETAVKTPEIIRSRIATMACKAAVKGNKRISREEMAHLIDELLTLENPYHCPHGRPTMISMSKYEIEKKFKRIV